uniref:Ribonuclease H-like domain-containing protein n=1 Tax=Tanacetum cinerariifolium TaxID=118510 RepID=A0A6L2MPP1_TANCI|nr:ribonuclease H-like domain-containing protein [Tanacetum cinerariifolium]
MILEKIIIDLEDEVVSLLEKEKANLEIIESLKLKGSESSENAISKSENQSENDCHVVEKGCDNLENSNMIVPGMFKINVSQSVSPISAYKTSLLQIMLKIRQKEKRRKRTSSKQNDKQVNNDVLCANKDFVHFLDLDTLSSVRRPKHSGVIWKKKGSSNASNVVLSSDSHSKLNKDVKRYSRKDLLLCNNSHRVDTRSAYDCNDAMNVSCNSRSYASYDVNDLFVFDDVSIRKSQVSKIPFRKKPRDSLNVRSDINSNNSLPRTIVQICLWIIDSRCSKHMTGNRALLTNFVKKFLGTVRFGNNDFAVIAGDVNDALRYKKKAVVVTSDPLALVAEKTKKITTLLAKAFNRKKYYAKLTNNNLRTSSASSSANKKPEYMKSVEKKEDKKVDEKKKHMSKVKCYNCKKEGHFAKDCKKAKVKDYNYYKTKMFLAKKDSDEQVLLAKDQAWMESSSDSNEEINANMVFLAKMEKVLSDSDESFLSVEETITEDNLYNGQKGIGFENPSYFEKAKDFRPSLYNEKVIGLGVRGSKHSGVIWKKKGSSNTFNVDLSSISHSKLNKDVKQYSRKDLLSCNNYYLGETSSVYVCNDAMNVSCNSRSYDSFDENNLFIFDDESVRNSQVSKMPFRKKPNASLNVPSRSKLNKSLPRIVRKWLPKLQPLAELVDKCPKVKRRIDKISKTPNSSRPIFKWVPKHMTGNRALLTNFVEKFLGMVCFGNNDFAVIAGYGDVVIGSMMIKKVYYVEGLGHNLFSVGQFCDKGLEVSFRKSTCFVRTKDGVDLLTGDRSLNFYTISLNEVASKILACLLGKASSSQSWLWHQRLSHLNFTTINNLVKNNLVRGLPKMKFEKDHLCSACEQGKIHQKHHKSKMAFASNKPLYLLYVDLYGPIRVESINEKERIGQLAPNHDVNEGESSAQQKSTVIRVCIPPRRSTRLTPQTPILIAAEVKDITLRDTSQLSITEQKSHNELEAKQNVQKVKEHLIAEEIDEIVEESPEVEKTADAQPMNVIEEEDESADNDYKLRRREKGKNSQADLAKMITDAIQQERKNLRVEITLQNNYAITNHIPSQVDSSIKNYMSALNIKFEGLHASNTPCRTSAIRLRDQDDPLDDAHPEGGIVQKGKRRLIMEPMCLENRYQTDKYVTDDDKLPSEKVSKELVKEMSETVDEAKLRKVVDEMLRQRCTSRDEHQYHID